MLDKLVPFTLILGLSSLAFAGSPPARAHRGKSSSRARPPSAVVQRGGQDHDDRFRAVRLKLASGATNDGALTVFVNGEGATLAAGFEDASANSSSIVDGSGFASVELPAFSGGAGRWNQVMSCVQGQFGDFDLTITDRRPTTDGYIMVMVGGSPSDIGESGGVAGIAPYTGSIVRGAVGFAFSEVHGGDTRGLCETVAHEIGHTLGLDHTYECTDTMSYLSCGDKSFQNATMSCGEWDARQCGGGATQNSYAHLASALGTRSPADPPTPPAPTPPAPSPDDEWDDQVWDDQVWEEEWDEEWDEAWDESAGEWITWEEWVEWEAGWDQGGGCSG